MTDKELIAIGVEIRRRALAHEDITLTESFVPQMIDRIEALSAEVERLRVALGRIAADDSDEGCYAAAKARNALEPKP